MFKISKPTKGQLLHAVELTVVAFVGSTVAVWIKQPHPFSKSAVIVALTAGVAAVVGLVRGFVFAG